MALIDFSTENGVQTITLHGRFDSSNATETENEMLEARAAAPGSGLIIDAADLRYISSAGLRSVLRMKKSTPGMKMINVQAEVYSVFEMVGLTEMIELHKADD